MFYLHLLEHLAGELLQFSYLDGSAFQPVGVASGGAELADGAEASAGESEGIIAEDDFGSSVVILILDLVDERPDVDANRAGFLAGAVGALHAPHGLGHGLLLGVDAVVVGADPVVLEIGGGDPLELDFVGVAILFPGVGVDDLGLVELGGGGEDVLEDFGGVLGHAHVLEGGGDQSGQHDLFYLINNIKKGPSSLHLGISVSGYLNWACK